MKKKLLAALFVLIAPVLGACDDESPTSASTFGPGGPNDRCVATADCPANEPVCNELRGACSECVSSSDCGAAEPVCDTARGRCEECFVDSDCPASEPICNPRNLECQAACADDGDCGGGFTCNTDTGRCFECVESADCTNGDRPICDDLGRCIECVVNDDCGAGEPICIGGSCEECSTDGDCGAASPFCHEFECIECLGSDQCPAAEPLCDNDGECRGCPDGFPDGCTGPVEIGDHCAPTHDCPGECVRGGDFPLGICTFECNIDSDCPENYLCTKKEGGICLPACETSDTCREALGSEWLCDVEKSEETDEDIMICIGD